MKHSRQLKTFLLFFTAASLTGCNSFIAHSHTYSEKWSNDATNHWHAATCEHSGEKSNVASHTYGDWIVTVAATEASEGSKKQVCSICGYENIQPIEKLPHTHTFSSDWSKDATNHWHAASCAHTSEKSDIASHTYGDWITINPATEDSDGSKKQTCSICGYENIQPIPKTGETTNPNPPTVSYGGYYSSIVSWENGEDLKNQLHELIRKDYVGLVYDGNWETNQIAEQSLTDFNKVNVVYSQKDDAKINTYGSGSAGAAGWQREHAFCASLMTAYNTGEAVGISKNGTGRATDFHNLFAAYGAANGGRGNKNLGNYDHEHEITTNAIYADTHADEKNYEPNDCDKGRLARAIFYMGVMYNEDEISPLTVKFNYKDNEGGSHTKSVSINAKYKPIQIVENYVDYSQITFSNFVSSSDADAQAMRDRYLVTYREDTSPYTYTPNTAETSEQKAESAAVLDNFAKAYSDYRYNEGKFSIGNLSTLIEWNSTLVDRQEMWHNEAVYSYVHQNEGANKGKKQGNRNPFVDYPELVDYVYGDKKNQPGTLYSLTPSETLLETNSSETYNYALTSYVDKYIVGQTLTSADYTFVKVNKDFTIGDSDFEDTNVPYTFIESDIGVKTITLTTPFGTVSYDVTVESAGGVNACNYQFLISKDSFSSAKIQTTPSALLSYGGISYNVSTGINDCPVAKKDTYAQIGNGTSYPAGTVIIESTSNFEVDGKSNISEIYLGLNTASGYTYNYKISIGGVEVKSGQFAYDKNGPQIYGVKLDEPKSGSIKIELTNCNKAVYISQISVNVN